MSNTAQRHIMGSSWTTAAGFAAAVLLAMPALARAADIPDTPVKADQTYHPPMGAASGALTEGKATCPPGYDYYAVVTVEGLKDQKGNLRVEVYPDNDRDFLVNRMGRTEVPTPTGEPQICVQLPKPGRFAIVVHQDRDADNSFDVFSDGFGFSNNPKLGFSKPDVDEVAFPTTGKVTHLTVDMHYVLSSDNKRRRGGRPH